MPRQRDSEWVQAASADEINSATRAGELAEYLGGSSVDTTPGVQRDEAWLSKATPEQISTAQKAGHLDTLLGRTPRAGG